MMHGSSRVPHLSPLWLVQGARVRGVGTAAAAEKELGITAGELKAQVLAGEASARAAREEARVAAKEAEVSSPAPPAPIVLEKIVGARIRGVGTADKCDTWREYGDHKDLTAEQITAAEIKAKAARAAAKEAAKEAAVEAVLSARVPPSPKTFEKVIGARVRGVGTAEIADKWLEHGAETKSRKSPRTSDVTVTDRSGMTTSTRSRGSDAMDISDGPSPDDAAADSRRLAATKIASAQRGLSARKLQSQALSSSPEPPPPEEMRNALDGFFGWVAQVGQQREQQAEVRQHL